MFIYNKHTRKNAVWTRCPTITGGLLSRLVAFAPGWRYGHTI